MMKLTLANVAKNNIKSNKAISGLFSALTLFAILAGNSSFIAEGIGQTLEETRRSMLEALPTGEEITAVKISTPSRNMIRKADREIHLNMNTMIAALNSFQIGYTENFAADQDINSQFNQGYMIFPALERSEKSDIVMNYQFDAENIDMNLDRKFLNADNLIFRQFYLNDYSMNNPAEITASDILITDIFNAEIN